MAADWTHVRIRRSTLEGLRRILAGLEHARELGLRAPDIGRDGQITLDGVLTTLIDRHTAHARRRRETRARRRQGIGRQCPCHEQDHG